MTPKRLHDDLVDVLRHAVGMAARAGLDDVWVASALLNATLPWFFTMMRCDKATALRLIESAIDERLERGEDGDPFGKN